MGTAHLATAVVVSEAAVDVQREEGRSAPTRGPPKPVSHCYSPLDFAHAEYGAEAMKGLCRGETDVQNGCERVTMLPRAGGRRADVFAEKK